MKFRVCRDVSHLRIKKGNWQKYSQGLNGGRGGRRHHLGSCLNLVSLSETLWGLWGGVGGRHRFSFDICEDLCGGFFENQGAEAKIRGAFLLPTMIFLFWRWISSVHRRCASFGSPGHRDTISPSPGLSEGSRMDNVKSISTSTKTVSGRKISTKRIEVNLQEKAKGWRQPVPVLRARQWGRRCCPWIARSSTYIKQELNYKSFLRINRNVFSRLQMKTASMAAPEVFINGLV